MKPMTKKDWTTYRGTGEIEDLSAVRGLDGALYSAWKPSFIERVKVLFGAPAVVGVLSERQPPITVVTGEDRIPR